MIYTELEQCPLECCGWQKVRSVESNRGDAAHVCRGIERRVTWRLNTVIVGGLYMGMNDLVH